MSQNGKTVFGPPPPPPTPHSDAAATTTATFSMPDLASVTIDGSGAISSAFGSIDLLTMAQSDMLNFDSTNKHNHEHDASTSRTGGSGSGSGTGGNGNQNQSARKPATAAQNALFHQMRDVLMKYSDEVSSNTSNHPDMQAFTSAFMASSSGVGGSGSSNSNSHSGGDSDNGSNSNKHSSDLLLDYFARVSLENAAMARDASAKASHTTNHHNGTTHHHHNSSSSKSSSTNHSSSSKDHGNNQIPFPPVVNMMFGSATTGTINMNGHNGGKHNKSSKNMNMMSNVIPPPPAGWPPGAAAAAAAALAAASNGAASVTVPMGSGSISVPLGVTHTSFQHGFTTTTTSGNMTADWMRQHHSSRMAAAAAAAMKSNSGSGNNNSNNNNNSKKEDEYNNSHDSDADYNSDEGGSLLKPAPQDRTSGMDLTKNQRHHNNHNTTTSSDNTSMNMNTTGKNSLDNDTANAAAAELLREEEEAACKHLEEEEKARRAVKKKEKKNRKKEKAKREAALKAIQAALKKREKAITSWRSRVVTACTSGEVHKIETLISDNPFKDAKQNQIDPDLLEELSGGTSTGTDASGVSDHLSFEEEVQQNMTWLLPSCLAKVHTHARETKHKEIESRSKLGIFVMKMAFHVVFIPRRDGRSALHTASVIGDVSFVELVVQHRRNILEQDESENHNSEGDDGKVSINTCLDLLCQDLGWSPLHYAAASGWNDVVEVLLEHGCEIGKRTDPSLTCRISNEQGVTAKELIEFIHAGDHANNLEFNSNGLQDIIDGKRDSSAKDRAAYEEAIESLIGRLNDVELNGYTPLKTNTENRNDNSSNDELEQRREYRKSTGANESNKSSKKKKKKKKKDYNDDNEESSVTASVASTAKRTEEVDPMVTALLAMGFTEEQIHSAADACGGTDRATADDLVEWILGGGVSNTTPRESTDGNDLSESIQNRHNSVERNRVMEQNEKQAAMEARKEAEEAEKREVEAKAAAERLAAKREEQKRIRREWNNREQLRQQEEVKARLAEEVERKRRIEIEKAKAAAQRAAKERAAASAAAYMLHHGGSNLQATNTSNTNVGATPLFQGAPFSTGDPNSMPIEYSSFSQDVHSTNIPFGMQQSVNLSFPQATSNYASGSAPGVDADDLLTPDRTSRSKSSKKSSPVELAVNGYEFPVLGTNMSSSPPRRQRSKNKDSPNNIDNRKEAGPRSNRPRKKKNESPSQSSINRPVETIHPRMLSSQMNENVNLNPTEDSYESNHLGEIRATAKEFVPTNFTVSASPQPPPGLMTSPSPIPPGLMNSKVTNPILPSRLTSGSSTLSNDTMSSVLPNALSVPFDRSGAPSPALTQPFNISLQERPSSTNPILNQSPVPSAASSIVGLSTHAHEDNIALSIGNSPTKNNGNDLLGSTVPLSSSLGMLESSNSATTALSGISIWGGAAPTIPATSGNLGGLTFNFPDDTGATGSGDDRQKKEGNSSSMWGTGVPSLSGGGGSIW